MKKKYKQAFGENTLGGKLYNKFPELFAHMYYPVFLKSYCSLSPPVQWKGGMLHELFKKGSSYDKSNYRDVMLGSNVGKNTPLLGVV